MRLHTALQKITTSLERKKKKKRAADTADRKKAVAPFSADGENNAQRSDPKSIEPAANIFGNCSCHIAKLIHLSHKISVGLQSACEKKKGNSGNLC